MNKLKWYSWLGLGLALIILVVLGQHSIATFQEGAGYAFWPVMAILGVPALFLIGLSLIPLWRNK